MRLFLAIAFLLLAAVSPVRADNGLPPIAGPDMSSPRAVLQAYMQGAGALEASYEEYRAAKTDAGRRELLRAYSFLRQLFDLRQVPPAQRYEVSGSVIASMMDIMARLPAIDLSGVPGLADGAEAAKLPDRWRIPDTDIQIVRIADGDQKGEFQFSAETVARVPEFHEAIIGQPPLRDVQYANWAHEHTRFTGPFFSYGFADYYPALMQDLVLGTPVWKVKLIILLYLAFLLLVFIAARIILRLGRGARPAAGFLLHVLVPVAIAVSLSAVHRFVVLQINPSGEFGIGETLFFSILLYASIAWAVWNLCFLLIELIIATPLIPEGSYDAHLLRLVARVAAALGVAAVIIYGANQIGIPAIGIVAGMGVGGFALALAAQSTVENLFGGVSIFADRPFRVGQFIRYGSDSGVVETVGPRSARIRGLDGTLQTVPNSDLAKMHITNYSMRTKYLFRHVIGLRYETSPDQFEWLLEDLRQTFAAHPLIEQTASMPRIRIIGFGASSIDVEIRANILTTAAPEFFAAQEELLLAIMRAVEAAGTGFAFPSQTAYLARDSGLDADAKAKAETAVRQKRETGAGPAVDGTGSA